MTGLHLRMTGCFLIDGSCRLRDGEPGQSGGTRHPSDGSVGCCYGSSVKQTNFSSASIHSNEHLSPLLHDLKAKLSFEAVSQLVHHFADVFSRPEFDLGRTEALPHRIETGDDRPDKQPLRQHPKIHEDFIDEHLEKMLAANVIEPCASPWASNVVLAKKSDGTLRFCVDYRRLNDCTYKDSFPLPRIDDCLDAPEYPPTSSSWTYVAFLASFH